MLQFNAEISRNTSASLIEWVPKW